MFEASHVCEDNGTRKFRKFINTITSCGDARNVKCSSATESITRQVVEVDIIVTRNEMTKQYRTRAKRGSFRPTKARAIVKLDSPSKLVYSTS